MAYRARVEGTPTPTAGDDADAAEWVSLDDALAEGLAFDHGEILRAAYVLIGVLDETDHGGGDLGVTPGGVLVGHHTTDDGEDISWTATITGR